MLDQAALHLPPPPADQTERERAEWEASQVLVVDSNVDLPPNWREIDLKDLISELQPPSDLQFGDGDAVTTDDEGLTTTDGGLSSDAGFTDTDAPSTDGGLHDGGLTSDQGLTTDGGATTDGGQADYEDTDAEAAAAGVCVTHYLYYMSRLTSHASRVTRHVSRVSNRPLLRIL